MPPTHARRLAIIRVSPSFPSDSATELARLMKDAMQGAKSFATSSAPKVEPPFARSWAELFDILVGPSTDCPMLNTAAPLVGEFIGS